jgi:tetrapyrrole methylase family protein/MazG family protein
MSSIRDEELGRFSTLVKVVEKLRSPEGCPWDRQQTARSLRNYAMEEAYEVIEAIDAEDPSRLCEELGDLLLQVVLHAQIGREEGRFDIEEVITGINSKLIRRHAWVFGNEKADSPEDALKSWNRIKVDEKGGTENGASILDGVPRVLPALFKAFTITGRAAQVGFDWQKPGDVITKLREELEELESSIRSGAERDVEAELGDVLFVIANLARHLKVNPELALEKSNRKFLKRFAYIERRLSEKGLSPQEATLEEMDALWDESKALE